MWGEGSVLAPATGDYQFKTYSNGGIKVWIDNRLGINHYRQNWLSDDDQVKLHLEANHRYPIKIEWTAQGGNTVQLSWKTPSAEADRFSLWSEVADGVDYYFVYGPNLDDVVAGYRQLTGRLRCCRCGRSACGSRVRNTRMPSRVSMW